MAPAALPSLTAPAVLEGFGVRLEPMQPEHEEALRAAAADGGLWRRRFTPVPEPEKTAAYIARMLEEQMAGLRCPWIVRETGSGRVVGSTTYHDIVTSARRAEIGSTFHGRSWQRSHVNTACKWLLPEHAFERRQCSVVGWRTDILNTRSQAARERPGAKKDGVIRRAIPRRDGTLRDTVLYSVLAEEWREPVRARVWALPQRPAVPATAEATGR